MPFRENQRYREKSRALQLNHTFYLFVATEP